MSDRSFERATLSVPGTKAVPGYIVRCMECGASEKIATNTYGGSMAPEGIAQKFRNKGWVIGSRDGRDVCSKCQARQRKSRASSLEKKATNVISMTIKADPPRQMSRDDRRVIFAKLNDVYIDESKGYDNGWSDQRVAKDLGVPLAWVKEIREENFGLESANEDARAVMNEARELLAAINDKRKQFEEDKEKLVRSVNLSDFPRKADEVMKKLEKLSELNGLK